jgi:hypothetical protein
MGTLIVIIVIAVLLAGGNHHRHYRRNRRAGCGIWFSLRGPFGTRETVSRRWGDGGRY